MPPQRSHAFDGISKTAKIFINGIVAAVVFGNVAVLWAITRGAALAPDLAQGHIYPIFVGRRVVSTVYVSAHSLSVYHWVLAADVIGLFAAFAIWYSARKNALKRAQLGLR